MGAMGSISYLGQLQDPLQRPPHVPQLSTSQGLLVPQLAQVIQALLPTVPARLRQPCREDGLVTGPSMDNGSLHPIHTTLIFLLRSVMGMMPHINGIQKFIAEEDKSASMSERTTLAQEGAPEHRECWGDRTMLPPGNTCPITSPYQRTLWHGSPPKKLHKHKEPPV